MCVCVRITHEDPVHDVCRQKRRAFDFHQMQKKRVYDDECRGYRVYYYYYSLRFVVSRYRVIRYWFSLPIINTLLNAVVVPTTFPLETTTTPEAHDDSRVTELRGTRSTISENRIGAMESKRQCLEKASSETNEF